MQNFFKPFGKLLACLLVRHLVATNFAIFVGRLQIPINIAETGGTVNAVGDFWTGGLAAFVFAPLSRVLRLSVGAGHVFLRSLGQLEKNGAKRKE